MAKLTEEEKAYLRELFEKLRQEKKQSLARKAFSFMIVCFKK